MRRIARGLVAPVAAGVALTAPVGAEAAQVLPGSAAGGSAAAGVAPAAVGFLPAAAGPSAGAAFPTSRARPGSPAFGRKVRTAARRYRVVGKPYVWGASGPNAFDCSGLTQFVYRKAGARLPRTSRAQRAASRRISRSQLRVGDLGFWHSRGGRVHHVAIYWGGGRWLDASTRSRPVMIHSRGSSRASYGRAR